MTKEIELKSDRQIYWDNLKREIAKKLHPKVFQDNDDKRTKITEHEQTIKTQVTQIDKLRSETSKLNNEIIDLKTKEAETELDRFCSTKFKEVSKFAYKDKGIFKELKYGMYPNEMIQPDVFIVNQIRRDLGARPSSIKSWAVTVGERVDKTHKWTSDDDTTGYPDIYQDIYAAILDPKQDCETHSGIVSSIEPEFGIAYGFCGTGGHAWNVFIYKGELWCLETNTVYDKNDSVRVFKYSSQKHYKIHWIFTKDHTYQCVGRPTNFGTKVYK